MDIIIIYTYSIICIVIEMERICAARDTFYLGIERRGGDKAATKRNK